MIACGQRAGRPLTTQSTMKAAIEKAGFVDVHEHVYKVPLGPWAKNDLLKEAGRVNYLVWTSGLEGYAMWLLTKFGAPEPWTKEEVHVFLASVRKELSDPSIHAYQYVYVWISLLYILVLTGYSRRVWARKPTEEDSKAKGETKTPEVDIKVEK